MNLAIGATALASLMGVSKEADQIQDEMNKASMQMNKKNAEATLLNKAMTLSTDQVKSVH